VQEGGSAAPVAQDEERVMFERFVCQFFAVFALLQSGACAEQTADTLCKNVLGTLLGNDVLATHNGLERVPVCTHQCIYGEFAKF
jgi:hypothetical protein